MKLIFIIIITKITAFLMRFFGFGHGTTWPGEIALRMDKDLVGKIINQNKKLKTILIVGTNGKTTSAKLIKHVLFKSGHRVFSNQSGANLLNGVASTLVDHASLTGKISYDEAVLEIDENVLPIIVKQFSPSVILMLNLFRDQLDRYGEIDIIALKWHYTLEQLDERTTLIMNGQDPQICNLGSGIINSPTYYFGVKKILSKKDIPHEADSIYCPRCSSKLVFSTIAYSHIGDFSCPKCVFSEPKFIDLTEKINIPMQGLFNRYNFSAVALLLDKVFNVDEKKFAKYIADYTPGFGRQEVIDLVNKKVLIQLSKNPVGFNQSIELLQTTKARSKIVLLALNDQIPDGRDISWIWDVDFESLAKVARKIFVTGDRAYDLGIRLQHALKNKKTIVTGNVIRLEDKIFIYHKINEALEVAIKATGKKETLYIFPVYSAMLEIRKILTGDEFKTK